MPEQGKGTVSIPASKVDVFSKKKKLFKYPCIVKFFASNFAVLTGEGLPYFQMQTKGMTKKDKIFKLTIGEFQMELVNLPDWAYSIILIAAILIPLCGLGWGLLR